MQCGYERAMPLPVADRCGRQELDPEGTP